MILFDSINNGNNRININFAGFFIIKKQDLHYGKKG